MATHRIPILGFSTVPDDSEESYFEPLDANFGANDILKQLCLVLKNPSGDAGIHGAFQTPQNYVGTPKLIVQWSAVGTTANNFAFGLSHQEIAPETESLDPASYGTTDLTTDAKSTTARRLQEASLTLTGTFVVGEHNAFFFFRDDSADTLAEDVYVTGLFFEYADA